MAEIATKLFCCVLGLLLGAILFIMVEDYKEEDRQYQLGARRFVGYMVLIESVALLIYWAIR